MQLPPRISVVSPVYQAATCVPELCRRICNALEALDESYEIVLVEDGSQDDSWLAIVAESVKRPGIVRGFRLSRNFGQHAAITACLGFARGDYTVVMDCDLQDRPEEIPRLYETAVREQRDIVLTRSAVRPAGIGAAVGSRAFHHLLSQLRGEHFDFAIRNFSILSRNAVAAFLRVQEYHRHYLGVLSILGYRPLVLEIPSEARHTGKSSYTFFKRFTHAIDGITAHSTRLLYLAIYLGVAYGIGALCFLVYVIYTALTKKEGVPGWASAITFTLLTASVLCTVLGILAIYIGKIFYEVKGRPIYFVSDMTEKCDVPQDLSQGTTKTSTWRRN